MCVSRARGVIYRRYNISTIRETAENNRNNNNVNRCISALSLSLSPHLEIVYLLQSEGVGHVKQLSHIFLSTSRVGVRMQQNRGRGRVQRQRRLLHHDRRLGRSLAAAAGASAFRKIKSSTVRYQPPCIFRTRADHESAENEVRFCPRSRVPFSLCTVAFCNAETTFSMGVLKGHQPLPRFSPFLGHNCQRGAYYARYACLTTIHL